MTEAQQVDTSNLNEYEALKHNPILPEDLRTRWIKADQAANWMTYDWNKIIGDEDLTPEAKVRRAQEVYDARAPKVESERKALRQDVQKAAEREEKASIPKVKGVSIQPGSTDELIAAQNEMFRLQRNIEKRQSSKGPFPFDVPDYLREQYAKGLEQGGVAGAALCRGALMLSEDMGLDDSWLPREDKHREALDRAWRLQYIANSMPTSAPSIPRALHPPRTLSRRPERRRDSSFIFAPGAGELLTKRDEVGHTGLGGSHEATAPLPAESPSGKKTLPKKKASRKRAWK